MKKFNVSESTLVARINRMLRKNGEQLHKSRSAVVRQDLGDYYIRNTNINSISATFVDIEALGRELKMLGDYEQLERDE